MEPSINSRSEVNFVSDIDGDVFGSSWRDTAMMKTLLPKPEISISNNSGGKRYPGNLVNKNNGYWSYISSEISPFSFNIYVFH